MKIAFTGTRNLDSEAIEPIWEWLFEIPYKSHEWHVGDANGIDELVRNFAQYLDIKLVVHEVIYFEKWGFAERSQRLINSLNKGDLLIAFPNKECPKICTPKNFFSGHGSGTWGTIAYAKKREIQIQLFPLVELCGDRSAKLPLPGWLTDEQESESRQLTLF